MSSMLVLGHGYSAAALSRDLLARGWQVFGTTRSPERAKALAANGVAPLLWPETDLGPVIARASHVLISAAPGPGGDPFLQLVPQLIQAAPRWVGYLSTTGVYGDRGGDWVDEDSPLQPEPGRGSERAEAEAAWLASGLRVHVFRLSGIYGPGRGPFAKVRNRTARAIIKPGQVFGRIHVDDIANVLGASIARPDPGRIYNVCDDEPAPPEDVLDHAARLLGLPPPPRENFATAEMTPMARSFYAQSRRVRNDRIKAELGVKLRYPGYREGLAALLTAERD